MIYTKLIQRSAISFIQFLYYFKSTSHIISNSISPNVKMLVKIKAGPGPNITESRVETRSLMIIYGTASSRARQLHFFFTAALFRSAITQKLLMFRPQTVRVGMLIISAF